MAWLRATGHVQDTTSTSGYGPFALDNTPPRNCQPFGAVCDIDDVITISIQHRTLNEWLDCIAIYTGVNELTVADTIDSSNAGGPVNFSAGIKDVAIVWTSETPIDGGEF